MCGIAGFIEPNGLSEDSVQHVKAMAETLYHRGPDASGVWFDRKVGIALAHCRLSIIDTSSAGHQPMFSQSGRYVIAFNGEIYNHVQLRKELEESYRIGFWRGRSDTETLLFAIEKWGLELTLKKVVGMFAFALWDSKEHILILVRDRLGEKPMYYGWQDGVFLFGSELKALRIHPAFKGEINRDALAQYFRYGYIPSPHTIYSGIYKLLPGTFLTVRPTGESKLFRYWSVHRGSFASFSGSCLEAADKLENLLRESISLQMVADVPVGAFLSGGVDSSLVVAIMQSYSSSPIKTFTIGFYEKDFDESDYARNVAKYLGTDHTELRVSFRDAISIIPKLPRIYDEPFADSSQIPTYILCSLAKNYVTVALSGDGGDEIFGGYTRYLWARKISHLITWVPLSIRSRFSHVFSGNFLDFPKNFLDLMVPRNKSQKIAEILSARNYDDLYRKLVSVWLCPTELVIGCKESESVLLAEGSASTFSTFEDMMMYTDLTSYLPDDILVKVDRAAMAVSLETRMPFLDHRVVEFAFSLPVPMKIRKNQGKWLLRQVLYRYIPKVLVERPKKGFSIPLGSWLRGPLREWAEALIDERRLRREGYLNPCLVRRVWIEHLNGRGNFQNQIWCVLMFQAWLDEVHNKSHG